MKATLKQIAEDTGLSISTVSRVITGKGYVSDEARKLIEESIRKLEYTKRTHRPVTMHPNDDLVMILVGGIKSSLSANLVECLINDLEKKNKRAFVAVTLFSPERERRYLQFAADNHFFGVIAMTIIETPETVDFLRHFPCPLVVLNRYLPSFETDYLHIDYYKMGFVGTEYLISHGHKHIVFIGGNKNSSITQDKQFGFEDCMRSHGLDVSEDMTIYTNRLIYENGKEITDQILSMPTLPTGIVSSNDISVSILNEFLMRGIRVPDDISIFTCEDSNLVAHCQVPMTAMTMDEKRISADTVKTLFRRWRQPGSPHKVLTYDPILIERESITNPRAK